MSPRELLRAFAAWRDEAQDLVLATVYRTAGSTYSKAGARMLITADGRFQGMLSGGCLEGDLAERAAAVSNSGRPQAVSYDLGGSDEELWGLGVGCDGLMHIFLQPLSAATGFQPFAAMAEVYSGDATGVAVTVIASEYDALVPGATRVSVGARVLYDDIAPGPLPASDDDLAAAAGGRSHAAERQVDGHPVTRLVAALTPPPRILVLGAGLDAEPVVRLIAELGWRATVQDHRPAYIAKGDFDRAERVLSVAAGELAAAVDLEGYDAAVVMSHHLRTDRCYLELLADTSLPYIGLLGPPHRRRRLLADLGDAAGRLEGRLHGPAGLDIGGRGPASIALSIVAGIHRFLFR